MSENLAVVEIAIPADARIFFDGRDETSRREVTVGPLEAGQLAKRELTVRFSSGATVSKTLLLRGGKRYRVPMRDPRAAAPELIVQTGHLWGVWSVAFSPDGKQVLTGSGECTAILWEAATGTVVRRFEGHQRSVDSVAFSPDGKSILTASQDGTSILWDAATGKKLHTLEGCKSVAFSPDGRRLLTGSEDKTATLWDAATGKSVFQFEGDPIARRRRIAAAARQVPRQQAEVPFVAFSADGKKVLTGEADNTAVLWDADTGEQLRTIEGRHESVPPVAISPDGQSILTGSRDGTILWDAATGDRLRTFGGPKRTTNLFTSLFFEEQHSRCASSAAFAPDRKSLLTGSSDGIANLWDVTTGDKLHTFKGHKDFVTSIAFSPDGKRVLTGSRDDTAILWDVSSGDRIQAFDGGLARAVTCIAFSPDEKMLLTGYRDGTAIPWETATGNRLGTFETKQRDVASVAFSPDGKQVLTGSIDGAILWDSVTKDRLRAFQGNINSQAFSPDGKSVLTWQWVWSKTPVLWDVATGARLRTLKGINDNGNARCVV